MGSGADLELTPLLPGQASLGAVAPDPPYPPELLAVLSAIAFTPRSVEVSDVFRLAWYLDRRDPLTVTHSEIVGELAERTARQLGMPERHCGRLRLAGALHDVGKVMIPAEVLASSAPLTDRQLEMVRRHPEIGARMIYAAGFPDVACWVMCHHERPDGRGYPNGLIANEVPLGARILAVCDSYEAMISERSYSRPKTPVKAAKELRRLIGMQFDGEVVCALLEIV